MAANPATVPLVEGFTLGPFATNCYLLHVPGREECWIIDASFAPAPLIRRITEGGLKPSMIILTHAHADHIAGLPEVRAAFPGVPVLLHRAEERWLEDPELNLSAGFGQPFSTAAPDRLLDGGETLTLGEAEVRVLHTPGHSPGGVTLHVPDANAALVGDTLFAGSIGRHDFPTSDPEALFRSIGTTLYALPDDTRVHPGHGPATTIGREKRSNPYVRAQ